VDDDNRDLRTGLTSQTTKRHCAILDAISATSISQFIKSVQTAWPDPSTQRTWVSAAIGALKRAHVYRPTFDLADLQKHVAACKQAIVPIDRRIRLEKPLWTPALSLERIATTIQNIKDPEVLLFAVLSVLTGGHRGTSVQSLQLRDVVLTGHMSSGLVPTTCTALAPAMCTTPQDIALIFRDGKTAATIGHYCMHIRIPPSVVDILRQVANAAQLAQAQFPPHRQFLFGQRHKTIATRVAKLLPLRELRRGMLRYLAWELEIPPEQLLLFSRHTHVQQLKTYLGAGVYTRDEYLTTTQASSALVTQLGL
jgi:hypothetical protein